MTHYAVKSYRLLVPKILRKSMHSRIKILVFHLLYQCTGNMKLGIRYARQIISAGETEKAERLLNTLYKNTLGSSCPKGLAQKQQTQFVIQSMLRELGAEDERDANLKTRISQGEGNRIVGTFKVISKFSGINISGKLASGELENESFPDKVKIFLNDHCIREQRLDLSSNRPGFSFNIKRPALDLFPGQARIRVCTPDGHRLVARYSDYVTVEYPDSKDRLISMLKKRGQLTKKGLPPPALSEIRERQAAYLKLYDGVNKAFREISGRPMFLMYGTLLGQYRDNGFIPGDDDFDTGYVSRESSPTSVKNEARAFMLELIKKGFSITLNRRGKPFRVGHQDIAGELQLDARPVWLQKGRIWAHKQACLKLRLEDFESTFTRDMHGTEVEIPAGSEAFLEAYYGPGWRHPDPGFSNSSLCVPYSVEANLKKCCFSLREQKELKQEADELKKNGSECGELIATAFHDLYPLDVYSKRCGW